MNDARLNVSIALTAAAHGAAIINHTEVLSLLKQPNRFRSETASTLEVAPTPSESTPAPTHIDSSLKHTTTESHPPALYTHPSTLDTAHSPPVSLPDTAPQETSTDTGVSMASPAESPTSSSQSLPSYLPPPLPPPSPSPPPSPDTPFGKLIESAKSFVSGSSKNKATETDARLLGDHLVSGVVVKDSIFWASL
jgi:hypothetical protein